MANKYIRHGETFCGDGTTSAAATSNGGVGAWNNINVFTGTAPAYGALAAGDDVYVRSKDVSGNNITATSASAINVGSSAAAEANPISWIIDDGAIWSGISGVVTVSTSAGFATITGRAYNNLIASNYNLVFSSTITSYGNGEFFTATNCVTKDIKIDTSANNAAGSTGSTQRFWGGTHINPWIKQGAVTFAVVGVGREYDTVLISPKIEIIGPLYTAATSTAVFDLLDTISTRFSVYGGEIITSATGLSLVKTATYSSNIDFYGLKYPSIMTVSNAALFGHKISVSANGIDGALGNTYFDYFYTYSSRFDGYYPTLNAQLELSAATPWSYSIYPYRTTKLQPAKVSVSKLWTQAAAVKTITMELLWPSSMTAPKSSEVWMTVQYTDNATGNKVTQTTLAYPGAALSSSTAAWSATTYGATLFSKLKLAITTQSSIKQDTEVMVTFFSTPKSNSANDIIIVCPDVVFS